jgi:iron/zinc/copper transport system permease protein
MLILSSTIGAVASIIGLYLSYTMNWASGPAIVLVAAIIFLLSFIIAPKQGFITKLGVKHVKED